jgi:NAD(P)H-quinone oxidoreductase subunit 4L
MFEVGLLHYIVLATVLFSIGLLGVLTSRNVIRVLMAVELMLNAVNINLVAFNNYTSPDVLAGQVFAIFVLTVSAAEAAVGLAVVIAIYRNRKTVDMEKFNLLKW